MDNSSATFKGTLYIVATPIGNLEDISSRAINTLKSVDTILAEDTRHSAKLLQALGLQKPLLSHHAHNEKENKETIINALIKGKSFALISDAGTPLISDPGFELVRSARQHQIDVVPIPGSCALVTALSAAGVPCDNFTFAGFLPAKQQARLKKLRDWKNTELTIVAYESTHRILDCIQDIESIYGVDYQMVLAKELTKSSERFLNGTPTEIRQWLHEDPAHCKGEFVLILPACEQEHSADDDRHLLSVLLKEVSLKQAVKIASSLSKTHKNELYKLALEIAEG